MSEETRLNCARHPKTETRLRCGKCDTLICPRCLVHTPVGARCPTCARVKRLPTYTLTPIYMMRALGAGVGLSLLAVLLWFYLEPVLPTLNFLLLLALVATGYLIGEGISLAVNRKQGVPLQVIAVGSVGLAFSLMESLSIINLRDLFTLLGLILAVAVAIGRLR